jgi:type III pantothenate kinase
MLASIDIGNTYMKVGLFRKNQLEKVFQRVDFKTCRDILIEHQIKDAIFSSVRRLTVDESEFFLNGLSAMVLSANTRLPITLNYNTVESLGMDRVAAAVGAYHCHEDQPMLVIDCGTCITCDYISQGGVFEGGSIHPGLTMRANAMHTFTDQLPLAELDLTPIPPGKSTISCLQIGTYWGAVMEINGMIEYYRQIEPRLQVTITGGDADIFETKLNTPIFVRPNLVLEGLMFVFEFNQ